MRVQVMRIRHVRMGMLQGCMVVAVAVRPEGHGRVAVQMMAVIMRVGVFMRQRLMVMGMTVGLQKMQHNACQHQCATDHQHPGARAIADGKGRQRANERRKGKHRAGSPCAKGPLRQQIQPQAHAVAGSAYRQQGRGSAACGHGLAQQECKARCSDDAQGRLCQDDLARIAF